MNRKEKKLLISFVNKSRTLFSNNLAVIDNDADWKMISYLMQQHFDNKIVTSTSLIQVSDLPFTTALRRVDKLVKNKLFIKRTKTLTGKSFSIHPSEKLINDFYEFLILIKDSLAQNLGFEKNVEKTDFHFGMSLSAGKVISPPHTLVHDETKIKKISIATNNNPTFNVIKDNIIFFENILGTKIDLHIFDLNELHNQIIKNKKKNISHFDIVAFNLPWLGELNEKKILLPLNSYLEEANLNLADFHGPALESSTYNNNIYGVPIETIPDIFFYRKDIINKYHLNPPKTFKDLLSIAEILQKKNDTEAVISWPGRKGIDLGSFFIETMANFGQPYVNFRHIDSNIFDSNQIEKNIKPMFDSLEAFDSAKFLKELLKYSPINISSMSYDDCVQYYADGKASMVVSWSSRASLFELNKNSPAHKNTSYLPRPAGKKNFQISPIGGFSFGLPSNIATTKINFCIKIIKHLVSPQLIKYYIEQGSLSCPLLSVSNDDEVKKISPMFENLKLMDIESKILQWPRVSIPQYSDIVNLVGDEIFEYLFLNKPINTTLKNCQNKSKKLFN